MGQKTNPNIFRLGKTKEWKSKYFEKKPTEFSVYTFKDLEIKNFIEKFFKDNGLLVDCCKLNYFDDKLDIFVSYSLNNFFRNKNKKALKIGLNKKLNSNVEKQDTPEGPLLNNKIWTELKKTIHNKATELSKSVVKNDTNNGIDILRYDDHFVLIGNSKKLLFSLLPAIKTSLIKNNLEISEEKISVFNLWEKNRKSINNYLKTDLNKEIASEKLIKIKLLNHYKNHLTTIEYQQSKNKNLDSFLKKFLESLNQFTGEKLNIFLTLNQVNKNVKQSLDKEKFKLIKKNLVQLRRYRQNEFFHESINLLFAFMKNDQSASLLAELLTKQFKKLKRHNFFLRFIKTTLTLFNNKKFYNLKKIKIKIKGRFNGAPRAKHKIISIGSVPIFTLNANVDYVEKTAYTANGTFGIKVWVYQN